MNETNAAAASMAAAQAQNDAANAATLQTVRRYALLPMREIHASNLSTQPERKTRVVSSVIS